MVENAIAERQQPAGGQITIRDRLNSQRFHDELARVLPSVCTPQRMVRVALTALTRVPKLAECDPASFTRCMMDLAAWGLEPDGRSAHLIPFWNSKRKVMECQLILDYKGLVQLAYRSGQVASITAQLVCENDDFVFDRGEVVRHRPNFKGDRGEVVAVYSRVVLKNGGEHHELMTVPEVNAVRARSRAADSGPWVTDWNEMAKKTAFRRASKWIPLSPELHDALDREEAVLAATEVVPQIAAPVGSQSDRLAAELAGGLAAEPSAEDAAESPEDMPRDASEQSQSAAAGEPGEPPPMTDEEKLLATFADSIGEMSEPGAINDFLKRKLDEGIPLAVHVKMVDLAKKRIAGLAPAKKR